MLVHTDDLEVPGGDHARRTDEARSDVRPIDEPAHSAGSGQAKVGWTKELIVYSDGASRGNPGPAGAGAVLTRHDGTIVSQVGKFLGTTTNNVAEYSALLLGLETALRLGAKKVEVVADSELLVQQLNGRYKVKNAGLKPLFEKAKALLSRFESWSARHVRRELNTLADEMSNRAIDERM